MTEISNILIEIDLQKSKLGALRLTQDNEKILEALRLEFLYESNRIDISIF